MRALKWPLIVLVVLGLIAAAYFAVVLNWSFSEGERAGWVQKLSKKGWLCKTWEGELSLISMPGTAQEKFLFTVHDDAVAESLNRVMGKRVTVHYEEKVGLPTTCFGDTRYFVTKVTQVDDAPLTTGTGVPAPAPVPAPIPGNAPAPAQQVPATPQPANPTPLPQSPPPATPPNTALPPATPEQPAKQ
jgi:hypothetical protein